MFIYVVCAVCVIPSTGEYGYVPITDISEDLSTVSLLASSDPVSTQVKYSEDLRFLYKSGATPIVLPIKPDEFQKLASYVQSKAAIAINAFSDIIHQYSDIFALFGIDEVDKNLASALYSAVISDNAPAFITKDMEVIEGDPIDVKDCLARGLDKFQEISAQMQDEEQSSRILSALMLSSGSEKISELLFPEFASADEFDSLMDTMDPEFGFVIDDDDDDNDDLDDDDDE